ncbi:MAG: prolipoprotein diacylglyceryl transferase [Clostridia bacterium]|nr:prolipoprotein diacylglyceryl transferase [Clostridia bacterium]
MTLTPLLAYEAPGINLFGFKITAYALVIVFGILVAFFVISLLFKRRNMSPDFFLTLFCICLPICLVTTRLFYCITDGMPVKEWFSFESIRNGGLSIIGGVLGGIVSVLVVCLVKKVDFFRVADCVVVGLVLAQAIGRWGNFANQEVYGAVVENEALQCFPFAVYINRTDGGSCMQTFTLTFSKWFGFETDISGGTWHYAFFFYESLFNFVVGVLLFVNAWKNGKKPNGLNGALYFASYGLIRSIMEPLRSPEYILSGGGVPWSLVTSILLLIGGLGLAAILLIMNKKKEGKFFGSLSGDPYGITKYIKDAKDEKAYFSKMNMMCALHPENYEQQPPKERKK